MWIEAKKRDIKFEKRNKGRMDKEMLLGMYKREK